MTEPLPTRNMREVAGRWVPAVPLRAPIDVRWRCSHQWTPHVYDNGMTAWHFYDCLRCGADVEAGYQPEDGPWPIRNCIARFFGRAASS